MTLAEILLVAVIIGILAALALPNYSGKHVEKHRGREAEMNLILIYNAQKRYRLDNDAYFICTPHCANVSINENLTLNLQDEFFSYSIAPLGANASGFVATATRTSYKDRGCSGSKMSITDSGGSLKKEGCFAWR